MNEFDMSQFMTEEEMAEQEAKEQQLENEMLKQYDRSIYCEDTNRITELVKNVFALAQTLDPNNMFYESNDNYIKWSLQALSNNPAQFILVEGLLSHRMKAGLLTDMYTTENQDAIKVLPSGNPMLKSTAFLGKIKDMKMVENIKENVIRMAGIPIDANSENMIIVPEPLNPMIPNLEGFCICLINLDDQQMNNLKKASKVKKVSDRMAKAVDNFNTTTYGIGKMAVEGIVQPGAQVVGKAAGLAIGGAGVATFKGAANAVAEITDQIAKADIRNCREVKEIKHNVARIAMQFGKGNKGDSFSFDF